MIRASASTWIVIGAILGATACGPALGRKRSDKVATPAQPAPVKAVPTGQTAADQKPADQTSTPPSPMNADIPADDPVLDLQGRWLGACHDSAAADPVKKSWRLGFTVTHLDLTLTYTTYEGLGCERDPKANDFAYRLIRRTPYEDKRFEATAIKVASGYQLKMVFQMAGANDRVGFQLGESVPEDYDLQPAAADEPTAAPPIDAPKPASR
jgi:hypothetical protein